MLRHIWSLTCLDVIRDSNRGFQSLMHVIEGFNINPVPEGYPQQDGKFFIPLKFYIVSSWAWESDERPPENSSLHNTVRFVAPNDEVLVEEKPAGFVDVKSSKSRVTTVTHVSQFPFTEFGVYSISQLISNDGKTPKSKFSKLPFELNQISVPENNAPNQAQAAAIPKAQDDD